MIEIFPYEVDERVLVGDLYLVEIIKVCEYDTLRLPIVTVRIDKNKVYKVLLSALRWIPPNES